MSMPQDSTTGVLALAIYLSHRGLLRLSDLLCPGLNPAFRFTPESSTSVSRSFRKTLTVQTVGVKLYIIFLTFFLYTSHLTVVFPHRCQFSRETPRTPGPDVHPGHL